MSDNAPMTETAGGSVSVTEGTPNATVQLNTDNTNGNSIMAPEGMPDGSPMPETEGTTESNTDSTTNETNAEGDTSGLASEVQQHQETIKALEKDLRSKGVDFKQAIKEYEATGNISSRTLANLVNAGYPQEVIESFIAGRHALEERFTQAVYDFAGGEQEYFRMTQWASQNLPQSSLKAFNKALDSSDLDTIGLMVSGIRGQMMASRGTSNPTLMGNAGGNTGGNPRGFATKADMIKAMSDPRYTKDPQYTRQVEMAMLYTNF